MQIQHKTSKQIINVSNEHGTMLMSQGWEEYKEQQNGLQDKKEETPEEVIVNKPKRGRPSK